MMPLATMIQTKVQRDAVQLGRESTLARVEAGERFMYHQKNFPQRILSFMSIPENEVRGFVNQIFVLLE